MEFGRIIPCIAVFIGAAAIFAQEAPDETGQRRDESVIIVTNIVTNVVTNYRDGRTMRDDPLTIYHPAYIAFGFNQKDQVKVQLSFQYDFLYLLNIRGLFYGAYSQVMFWDLYNTSGPFRDFTFNPELFIRYESGYNPFGNVRTPLLDIFQLGFEHKSNGKDSTNSRSLDRVYAYLSLALGTALKVGVSAKCSYYFRIGDNPDIRLFMSTIEYGAFIRIRVDRTEILDIDGKFAFGDNAAAFGFVTDRYWAEVIAKVISPIPGVSFVAQGWVGFGETLIDYNRYSWAVRIGVSARN